MSERRSDVKKGRRTLRGNDPASKGRQNLTDKRILRMMEISTEIANPDVEDKESLAQELYELEGLDRLPLRGGPDDMVNWADKEARWLIRKYPMYYLFVRSEWAAEMYNKMVAEGI